MATIKPLHDRVVVRRLPEEEKSAGGIVIPDSAKEKPQRGEVISVGSGKIMEDGSLRAMAVKAGDTVLFGKYAGTEIKLDGEELIVMREDDIMGVLQ
jgi:chaperonin GroES